MKNMRRMWEIREGYNPYGEKSNSHGSKAYEEGYEDGYEEGYRKAMKEAEHHYGQRDEDYEHMGERRYSRRYM